MRSASTITLQIQSELVRDARLYACVQDDAEAVERIILDYMRLSGELRKARSRIRDIEQEGLLLDERLERLQAACRDILDL
jgi:hypothetical protein